LAYIRANKLTTISTPTDRFGIIATAAKPSTTHHRQALHDLGLE
jgi:hypothetical protein